MLDGPKFAIRWRFGEGVYYAGLEVQEIDGAKVETPVWSSLRRGRERVLFNSRAEAQALIDRFPNNKGLATAIIEQLPFIPMQPRQS